MEETTTKEQHQVATPLSNHVPHNNLGNSPPRLRSHREKGKGRGTTRSRLFSFPYLNDPITLRPGQHVIGEGQHFILRGQPQITVTQTTQYTLRSQTEGDTHEDRICHLCAPDNESSSENSVDAFHHCYIPPEPNESNAESVQREEEINERIRLRKLKRKQYKQNVQIITLDDLNPHGLYPLTMIHH
jgi:hypothetical protein